VNKDQVTEKLAQKLRISDSQAGEMVASVGEAFIEILRHDGRIRLQGFGTFGTRTNPQRKVHNKKNKKWYVTERNHGPYFKPSPQLKQLAQSAKPAVIGQVQSRRRPRAPGNTHPRGPAKPLQWIDDVDLRGAEQMVASYLFERIRSSPTSNVFVSASKIAKEARIPLAQVPIVCKSLASKRVIKAEEVDGRGTRYDMRMAPDMPECAERNVTVVPPLCTKGPTFKQWEVYEKLERYRTSGPRAALTPAPEDNAAGQERQVVGTKGDGGEIRSQQISTPVAPTATVTRPQQATVSVSSTPQPPSTMVSARQPVPAPAAKPTTPPATAEEQISALVAELKKGKKPDRRSLQHLQLQADSPEMLLQCLQWMVKAEDPNCGIKVYQFDADDDDFFASAFRVRRL
jgi:nucleoid DNA-binding protein